MCYSVTLLTAYALSAKLPNKQVDTLSETAYTPRRSKSTTQSTGENAMNDEEMRKVVTTALLNLENTVQIFENALAEIKLMRGDLAQHHQVMREYSQQVMENDNERMAWCRDERKRYIEASEQRDVEAAEQHERSRNRKADA